MPDEPYALIDCGDGRRLETFGGLLLDRPAPGATEPRLAPERWVGAATYFSASGWWAADGAPLGDVSEVIRIEGAAMDVRPAPSGQVGVFPEHAANASWLRGAVMARLDGAGTDPTADAPEILNLFAYTGLVTLIAAQAGARVVHVDASRPTVAWARRNAELSGLAGHRIRWIVDEALAFVRRESRRGRRYAGLVVDPPSYGHGGRGGQAAWVFDERIIELLDACAGIADPEAFWLVTTHTPGWDPRRLAEVLQSATEAGPSEIEALPLQLAAESGATLRLGAAARFDPVRPERR